MAGIVQSSEGDVASPIRIPYLQPTECVERKSCLTANQQHMMAGTPIGFLDFPSEIRNMIYELVLVREELACPCKRPGEKPYHLFGLVCASRSISREVSSIFYSGNEFDFAFGRSGPVVAFLQQIGAKNAAYIQQVSIMFPLSFEGPGRVTFDVQMMDALLSCVNLKVLTAVLLDVDELECMLEEGGDDGLAMEALDRTNNSFLAFRSLQYITVDVHGDGPRVQEIRDLWLGDHGQDADGDSDESDMGF